MLRIPPIPSLLLSFLVPLSLCPLAAAQIHVDDDATGANDGSSWQDAFTDLQDALAAAQAEDEIWLAEGLYRPSTTGDRSASFDLTEYVRVYGGFLGTETSVDGRLGSASATILSGDLNGDDGPGFTNRSDNSVHVVFLDYFGLGRLDRVTVRGGHADMVGQDLGGGLYAQLAPPELATDCVFIDNYARRGGGVYATGLPTLYGCNFLGNRALERGGGAYIVSFQSATPYLERCRFLANEVIGGGGEGGGLWGDWGDMVYCEFSGNTAPLGGGLAWGGNAWGITVSENSASQATGGVLAPYLTLRSSILWGNTDPSGSTEAAQIATSVGNVNESCIQGWTGALGGARNQSADPMFVLPAGADGIPGTLDDDFRLRKGSPCIDRGELPEWSHPAIDLLGKPRVVDGLACGDGGAIDMGAIERQALDGTSNYCTALPSSLGTPAVIACPCTQSVFLDPILDLEASPVPDGFGAFLVGPEPARVPFGNGNLCVGQPQRIATAPAAGGVMAAQLDLGSSPLLVPGSTWFVQALYRDAAAGGAGFNLSDAASLEIRS